MNAYQALQQRAAQAGRPTDPATGLPMISPSEMSANNLTGQVQPWTYGGNGYLPQERLRSNGAPFYGFGVGADAPADPAAEEKALWWKGFMWQLFFYVLIFGMLAHYFKNRVPGLPGVGSKLGAAGTGAVFGAVVAATNYATMGNFYNLDRIALNRATVINAPNTPAATAQQPKANP